MEYAPGAGDLHRAGSHGGYLCLWIVLSWRARLSFDRAHPDADVFEVVCGGTSDDFPDAHARPVLVQTASADLMGGSARHTIIATLIAVYGLFMTPLGWGWAAFVWGYALAWFLVNDRVKLLAYRILDPTKAPLLARKPLDLIPKLLSEPINSMNNMAIRTGTRRKIGFKLSRRFWKEHSHK